MKRTISLLTALLMVALLVFTGCGKSTSTSEASTAITSAAATSAATTLSVSDILSKSYDNMQAVKAFHFVLDHTGGGTPISMGVEMIKAEGDIVRPDKLQTTIDGTAMGTAIQVKLVTTDGKTLMTNPLSGKWEAPPDQFKVLSVFDPGTGIAAIIKGITTPTSLSDEKVGDALCYHLKGDIASEALSSIIGGSATKLVVNTEVWIEKEGFLVQQVKLSGKITDGEKDGIIRTLVFSNFNKDVNITLPQ